MSTDYDPDVSHVSVDDVKKSLDGQKKTIILDVRTREEHAKSAIPGSINIPVDQLQSLVSSVIPDKKRHVYVYCLSNNRSIPAARMMKQMGYTHVFYMANGLLAWRIQQYPLTG